MYGVQEPAPPERWAPSSPAAPHVEHGLRNAKPRLQVHLLDTEENVSLHHPWQLCAAPDVFAADVVLLLWAGCQGPSEEDLG